MGLGLFFSGDASRTLRSFHLSPGVANFPAQVWGRFSAVGIVHFGHGDFDRDSDDEPMDGMG